jgi:hypothetical protein
MKKFIFLLLLCSASLIMAEETKVEDVICNVSTIGSRVYERNRCPYFDEVMVGIVKVEPMTIRCARLRNDCYRKDESTKR